MPRLSRLSSRPSAPLSNSSNSIHTQNRTALQPGFVLSPVLTKVWGSRIITVKSKPRTRLAPQKAQSHMWQSHKTTVTVAEWRLIFCYFVLLPSWMFSGQLSSRSTSVYERSDAYASPPFGGMEPTACVFVVYSLPSPFGDFYSTRYTTICQSFQYFSKQARISPTE